MIDFHNIIRVLLLNMRKMSTVLCACVGAQYDLHFMKKISPGSEAANLLIGTLRELEQPLVALVRFTRAEQLADFTEIPVPTRFLFVYLGAVPGGGPASASGMASSPGLTTPSSGLGPGLALGIGGPPASSPGSFLTTTSAALGNGTRGAPLVKLEVVPPPDAAPAVTDAALQQAQGRAREIGRCMGALIADEVCLRRFVCVSGVVLRSSALAWRTSRVMAPVMNYFAVSAGRTLALCLRTLSN